MEDKKVLDENTAEEVSGGLWFVDYDPKKKSAKRKRPGIADQKRGTLPEDNLPET